MRRPRFRSDRRISTANFAALLAIIAAILVLAFAAMPVQFHHGRVVDLPKAVHGQKMPGADREDALIVAIQRDGRISLDARIVSAEELPLLLRDHIRSGAPPIVYIKADRHARYLTVSAVLDRIRDAGLGKVVFLVN